MRGGSIINQKYKAVVGTPGLASLVASGFDETPLLNAPKPTDGIGDGIRPSYLRIPSRFMTS